METSKPSNIALIKYMGKIPALKNVPTNASFSWTLESLRTFITVDEAEVDSWQPLERKNLQNFAMSEKGRARYLQFWKLLKDQFAIKSNFLIRSGNNFPADCGLASSASSFAALTQIAFDAAKMQNDKLQKTAAELADISRQGSGSSCRSFFSPWCVWDQKGVFAVELPYTKLNHYVLVVSEEKKSVSSSEAHSIVSTSPLFKDRPARAEARLQELLENLKRGLWDQAVQNVWDEFIDMHELFHTSQPRFSYFNNDVKRLLEHLKSERTLRKDSPLVTMDAGPNIHLLFNEEQKKLEQSLMNDLKRNVRIISSGELDV